jgi:hypothetical protein
MQRRRDKCCSSALLSTFSRRARLPLSTSLISVHSVSNSCPISCRCNGKHSKFVGLHKGDRNAGRGFGRELLTWDAFGHEMLTCSTQQNLEFVRLAVESLQKGVYPNVPNGAVSIANCMLLWDFDFHEICRTRAISRLGKLLIELPFGKSIHRKPSRMAQTGKHPFTL